MLLRILRGVGLLALGVWVAVSLYHPTPWGEPSYSPDGSHYLQLSTRPQHSLVPAFPGQGSDRPGFVTVFTAAGKSCGRAAVPLIWIASDFEWTAKGAYLPLVAEWDLRACRVTRFSQ